MAKIYFLASFFNFIWRQLKKLGPRKHRDVKRFDEELKKSGDLKSTVEKGVRPIDVNKVVGSVDRWQNLRSDFFYKYGTAITQRFIRIGQAMKVGKILPAIDVYKIKRKRPDSKKKTQKSEYYVVDGHHRVAMAKKLGQDFLDAHIVEYKIDEKDKDRKSDTANTESAEEKTPPKNSEKPNSGEKLEAK